MTRFTCCAAMLLTTLFAGMANGDLQFDEDITPDVIFGSGNANGSWTVDREDGVELGLRAKLRFDAANSPQNIFNSQGNGNYVFQAGQPVGGGFGFASGSPSTAVWNFEWSINTDQDGTSDYDFLTDLTYELAIDFDPTAGTNFLAFDPINIPSPDFADHAIGNNATGNGGGTKATDRPSYLGLIGSNNVAQNSWNMEFFDSVSFPFDANVTGVYTIRLTAFDGATQVAQSQITVSSVPEPATWMVLGLGLAGVALVRRKRR